MKKVFVIMACAALMLACGGNGNVKDGGCKGHKTECAAEKHHDDCGGCAGEAKKETCGDCTGECENGGNGECSGGHQHGECAGGHGHSCNH